MARNIGPRNTWKTTDGRIIPVTDLDNMHLENIYRKYISKGWSCPPKISDELKKRRLFEGVSTYRPKVKINLASTIKHLEIENLRLKEEIQKLKDQKWTCI